MDVRIERRDPTHVACVRHVGPYDEVAGAWKTLMKWGWSKVMFRKAETFGLCWDDPDVTPPEQVRYDACMTVARDTKTGKGVELREMAGGTFAVALLCRRGHTSPAP